MAVLVTTLVLLLLINLDLDLDAAAANRPNHPDDSITSSPHHSDELHTTTSDLTFVTPLASPELTPVSGNSKLTGSGHLLPERDVDDQAGANIVDAGNEVLQRESSFIGVYNSYVYSGDDYMRDLSPGDWSNVVLGDVRAQSAVLALNQGGRRPTNQQSCLNRTPTDIDMMQLPGDSRVRRRRQQQHQLSALGHHTDSFADEAQTLELNYEAISHENLI